jgi:dienelactone hydrolase
VRVHPRSARIRARLSAVLPALCALVMAAAAVHGQSSSESRRQFRDELLRLLQPSRQPANGRINAYDRTWEDWVKRTGELPPDFDALPSIPDLPDPLLLHEDGRATPVTTPALWARQRQALRAQVEQWIFGKMPPAPGNVRAEVTATHRAGGATVREVRLAFGPDRRATLRVELVVPDGQGPFPVFLTNHARNRPWIYTAVRRGYIACIYHATDPRYGNGDDSDAWIEVYPDYDWSTLARWAWAASRAVDYLLTLPEVDGARIGLAGHSRNGKQALLAAAFDERIGAVVPSSGNSGENDPWRYTTEPFVNESIELLTGAQSHWFHPRLRFFAGREDKLPVDQHALMALVAPRGLMLYSGYAESAGNPLGFEQAYRSALGVYKLLGREQNIWLHLRDGEHETTAGDVEKFIDFFDAVFGRRARSKIETWIHGYRFDEWRKLSGDNIDPASYPVSRFDPTDDPSSRRKRIEWALGVEPPGAARLSVSKLPATGSGDGWLAGLFRRPGADAAARARVAKEGMGWAEIPFGDDLKADLFYPAANPAGKWPVVIWLHPYAYQNGWSNASPWESTGSDLRLEQRPTIPFFVKRGFAVLAFDQIGFGARVRDARDFYHRYPKWSLMGKMVADTRAAIDALVALETVDASRISIMGYSLGGKVGLLTMALDGRVHSLAAVCAFDPLRASAGRGVEGVRHYSHLHGLMPRLGFFVGQESRLPFDFDDPLALAAARPVLVIAPTHDRYARVGDVRAAVAPIKGVTLETPEDFNRFGRRFQARVLDWLTEVNR